MLTHALAGELKRRGVEPSNDDKDHIALISEWDTFYGQTFPTTLENCFANPKIMIAGVTEDPPSTIGYTNLVICAV